MMDQRRSFLSYGISVEFVGESQHDKEVVKKITNGCYSLVLISPENITANPLFYNMIGSRLYKERMVAFVIDEAHCIKTW